jgi:hypothetical protein
MGELVRQQPLAAGTVRVVAPAGEVDVGADGEGARGDPVSGLRGGVIQMDPHS